MIQDRVIHEFHMELERAKQPGYVSRYDEFDHDHDFAPAFRRDAAVRAADRPAFQAADHQPRGPHRPQPQPSPPALVQHPPQTIQSSSPAGAPPGNSRPKPVGDNFGAGIF
jgi:stage V sporulation protein G